ncbi:MAG: TetR/AcrR family transcriptional repressor of nem operon [Granulosicoccus sp.]|jgi:TetR/AcrR family transcriptional repressor of nem operon
MNQKHDIDEVLSIGCRVFCGQGYSKLGMAELCRETGMTKGAFYNAFGSKQMFFERVLITYGDAGVVYWRSRLAATCGGPVERLLSVYVSMFELQPGIRFHGCLINNTLSELGGSSPDVSSVAVSQYERILALVEGVIVEAQQCGELDALVPSRVMSELCHATFFGALTRVKNIHDHLSGIETMRLLFQSLRQQGGVDNREKRGAN